MARRKEPEEGPEALLAIARRAHVLARALPEPDRSRILRYVRKLEAEAASLSTASGRPKARRPKQRREMAKPVRSAKAAEAKLPRS